MLDFTHIGGFSIELRTFQYMSCFIPYHSYSKMVQLENLADIERQLAFLIETLCNYTLDNVV